MPAPDGFVRLPDGIQCRCIQSWREPDGSHWCCNAGKRPIPDSVPWDPDARSLKAAQELYARFCDDLSRDAAMAKSRLVAGIQVAIREAAVKPAWQPIDTAPRSCRNIIITGRYANGAAYVEESYWDPRGHWSARKLEPPTHWMPLPAPLQ